MHRYKPNKNIASQVPARGVHFIVFADIAPLTRMREHRSIFANEHPTPPYGASLGYFSKHHCYFVKYDAFTMIGYKISWGLCCLKYLCILLCLFQLGKCHLQPQ